MTIKFGMLFRDSVPDFGSIEQCDHRSFALLAADIGKLNSTLTRATCQPLLKSGAEFNIYSGAYAIVVDEPAVYMYHSGTDRWYEVIPVDE